MMFFFCYYRQARIKALRAVFPDYRDELENGVGSSFKYPRPLSEPPSPSSSRVTTPAASVHGSDVEESDDSVDSEGEVSSKKKRKKSKMKKKSCNDLRFGQKKLIKKGGVLANKNVPRKQKFSVIIILSKFSTLVFLNL